MLADPRDSWGSPRLGHEMATSTGTLALASSMAVHAALLLVPGGSQLSEPTVPAMTLVQVQLIAPAQASGPAPRSTIASVEVAAGVAPRPAPTKAAELHGVTADREILAPVAESTGATWETAATNSSSVQSSPLDGALRNERENFAATPRSTPIAFLHAPEPDYPLSAREEGQEGLVLLRVRVSKEGLPVEIRIGTSSGIRTLDVAAVAGVRRWIFRPARVGQQEIEAWMEVPIRFRLERR